MALAPQYTGHRWGVSGAPHTLEAYLDYVCPYSAKMFARLKQEVFPHIEKHYAGKVQFVFRQQVQPWHPASAIVHEAALAVEKLSPHKFLEFSTKLFEVQQEYFDDAVWNLTRAQINESLAKLAHSIGVPSDKFLKLLEFDSTGHTADSGSGSSAKVLQIFHITPSADSRNAGSAVTQDLKFQVKLGRQTGVHVSPTVLFDGLVQADINSGWSLEQWKEFLVKAVV